jgi:lysozyme family protein
MPRAALVRAIEVWASFSRPVRARMASMVSGMTIADVGHEFLDRVQRVKPIAHADERDAA